MVQAVREATAIQDAAQVLADVKGAEVSILRGLVAFRDEAKPLLDCGGRKGWALCVGGTWKPCRVHAIARAEDHHKELRQLYERLHKRGIDPYLEAV